MLFNIICYYVSLRSKPFEHTLTLKISLIQEVNFEFKTFDKIELQQ